MALWNVRARRRDSEMGRDEPLEVEVPAEVEKSLKLAQQSEEELTKLREEDTANKSLIAKMQGDITELNNRLSSNTQTQNNQQSSEQQAPDYLTDPDGYFNHRLGPLVQVTLQNSARQELDMFSRTTADWSFFGKETTDMVRKGSLQQQATPDFIRNCYLIVKGNHSDEIAAGKYSLVEGGNGAAAADMGKKGKSKKAEFEPSAEQAEFAARYGISAEDLKKSGNKLQFFHY